ncbi:hypothetical protein K474DRAFT_914170 [Panus rudis PR-1116 ss-1]|nr:hypothetical protein K474DRAFT_914170 [Panus rudis PR-1116 ss-1]
MNTRSRARRSAGSSQASPAEEESQTGEFRVGPNVDSMELPAVNAFPFVHAPYQAGVFSTPSGPPLPGVEFAVRSASDPPSSSAPRVVLPEPYALAFSNVHEGLEAGFCGVRNGLKAGFYDVHEGLQAGFVGMETNQRNLLEQITAHQNQVARDVSQWIEHSHAILVQGFGDMCQRLEKIETFIGQPAGSAPMLGSGSDSDTDRDKPLNERMKAIENLLYKVLDETLANRSFENTRQHEHASSQLQSIEAPIRVFTDAGTDAPTIAHADVGINVDIVTKQTTDIGVGTVATQRANASTQTVADKYATVSSQTDVIFSRTRTFAIDLMCD